MKKRLNNERGASLLNYTILTSAVAVMVIGSVTTVSKETILHLHQGVGYMYYTPGSDVQWNPFGGGSEGTLDDPGTLPFNSGSTQAGTLDFTNPE